MHLSNLSLAEDTEQIHHGIPENNYNYSTYTHPGRLTWNIIMEVWKIIFLSKWVICRLIFQGVMIRQHHEKLGFLFQISSTQNIHVYIYIWHNLHKLESLIPVRVGVMFVGFSTSYSYNIVTRGTESRSVFPVHLSTFYNCHHVRARFVVDIPWTPKHHENADVMP